ncbi:7SK snRNA methylphosphate capping enzyme [Tetranychus urticae]|uniref:RNA methyltransferase n=1 Tax=Tetranychus urticae TaxID=32264 RepID=T1K935_TETUR|nr:7SK snRNA methylphosphate capping enzyme [Tetranychus urticae]
MALANANVVVNCDEEVKPKRRYTLNSGGGRYNNNKRKRRNDIVLPTKFLLGGNIHDPLNLASFSGAIDQVTPESSPLPTPKHKKEVEVLIPVNLHDPLNLNSSDPEAISPIPVSKIIKSRKRKRKRTDSETTVDDEPGGIGDGAAYIDDKNKQDYSTNKESTNEPNEIGSVNGTENDQHDESVIPSKCPKTSSNKKEIDRGNKGTGSNRGSDRGADMFKKPTKEGEKNATRASNNHSHHHHSRPSHPRSGRNQSHAYHHYSYHRQRQQLQHQQMQHKFRPKDAKFQYGNYDRYYGYRNQNLTTDPRLRCFKEEWFEDQDILDIGCNVGHVTLTIARDFNPKQIVGIDIDENLIKAANRNIKHYVNINQNSSRKRLDTEVLNKNKRDITNPDASSSETIVGNNVELSQTNVEKDNDNYLNLDETKTDSPQQPGSTECLQSPKESLSAPINISTDVDSTTNAESIKENQPSTSESVLNIDEKPCLDVDVTPSKSSLSVTSTTVQESVDIKKESSSCTIDQPSPCLIQQNKTSLDNDNSQTKQSEENSATLNHPKSPPASPKSISNLPQQSNVNITSTQSQLDAASEEQTQSKISSDTSTTKKIPDFTKPLYFPKNVKFICHNFVLDSDDLLKEEKPEYDCILCLSVTKWIHLNFGDDGLKRAFKRMYAQLRPGGKLILEAQPWCSYKKKKFISECTLNNYWSIKFKPEHFNEYLLSKEVGFSTLELVDIPEHASKGFRRPIFLFRKLKDNT